MIFKIWSSFNPNCDFFPRYYCNTFLGGSIWEYTGAPPPTDPDPDITTPLLLITGRTPSFCTLLTVWWCTCGAGVFWCSLGKALGDFSTLSRGVRDLLRLEPNNLRNKIAINHRVSIEWKSPCRESYTVNSHWKMSYYVFSDVRACLRS